MIKQVIIIRKDLNMRKGKMCAQAAHASIKILIDRFQWNPDEPEVYINFTDEMYEWLQGKFTKIVVSCDSEEELFLLHQEARAMKLPCSIIEDCGETEFKEPTYTAIAIGPAQAEEIDKITGHLKLL